MSSVVSSYAGRRDLPAAIAMRDRLVDGRVGLDRDHVGARQHHLAHDGVAELEDRVDELALLGLDRRPPAAATSAIVRISASVTNGPPRKPLPGSTTLASPMKPRVSTRSGGKPRDERRAAPRRASAARSAVLHRERLRRDLGEREHDDDLDDDAERDARPCRSVGSSTVPSSVAEIIWQREQHAAARC